MSEPCSEQVSQEKQKFITGKGNWCGAAPEKRRAPWRYDEVTGKYNDRPADKDYFKVYFKTHGTVKVECPLCGRSVQRCNLSHHKKSVICAKNRKESP